ncbi:MAG: choice-of-anchor D domain-containing protein [Candidatus Cloacimonetes bacterium]|nr:choice-of-anchor D domain-containing protein [Candidatus Cloacimonadota bacterium]
MKKFTILFLLLMLIGIATADLYTIGTGTSTQSYIPFYGLYDYSWSKVIYTATELSAAGLTAGPIDGIGFDVGNTPSNYVAVDQRMYIRHTAVAEYDATDNMLPDNTAFQNVYYADYTWNGGGWHYIMFSSAFNWDGTSNIEISWENWDGDYVSGYPNFRYTSTTPAYLAVYKYADNTFPATLTGSTTYNRPNIQIVTPSTTAPNAAVLGGPVDGSTLTTPIVNLSWSPGTGGLPTGYKLYLGTTTPPAFVADLGAVSSYTATDLDYETIYYWQVVPYNVIGDATDCPVWSFTTMDNPVISSFPWTEDFGTVSGDWPVLNWTQRSGLYPDPTGTSVQWVRDEWLNGPTGNNAAKINIYGTSRYGWLITPPIAIPASGYELMFDLGLTRYGNANAVDPAQQMDDRFIVAISDSPDMSNPTLLREWNNSGSANVFNDIPNTGTMVIIDLDGYAGTKYIAFYGESTVSGGDNDLFVDNVTVREQAAGPILSVTPDAWDFGAQFINTTHSKAFTITNTGSGSLNVSSVSVTGTGFALAETFSPVALLTGESANFTVNFLPTEAGVLTGSVMINDNRAVTNIPLSGECVDPTVYEIPWTEGFEAYNTHNTPIFGWMQEGIAGTTEWIANNTETSYNRAPRSGDWNAFLRYGNTRWMFKPVQLEAGVGYRAIVWARQDGATATNASVGISFGNEPNAASMTETILDPTGIVNGDYQRLAGVFTPATSGIYYLGILGTINSSPWYITIDDIEIEIMGANDLMAMGISGNVTPSVGIASDYTISVYNNGTAPQSTYDVKLYDSNDVELATAAGITVAPASTEDVVVSWTPTVDGPMSIYGKVILAGDINPSNDATNPILISVQPEGVLSVTIGDGSATARMPLDFYYKSSLYQNIYSAAEIGTVGNITSLAIYNQFSTASVPNTPVKIWLGLTAQENLNDGWISSNEMTLVFDGTMDFPGGQNTITFPLLAPFAYSGGNLVVMFYRPLDENYYSSSDYFKTQTGDTGRARNMYSDSTVYDPASPTGGTLTGIFPQTTLILTPMTGAPVFAVNPDSHDFGEVNIGDTRSQNFTIMNAGGGSLGINAISIAGSASMELSDLPTLPAALGTGEAAVFTVTYAPTALGEDTAIVTITDDQNNRHVIGSGLRKSVSRDEHTVQLTGAGTNDITIGDGSQTARIPLDFFYKSSLFETIYTADEMSNFEGMITGLKLYNQFFTDITATPLKIWLGSTTQTDLSADWIPSTELTQVFDGTLDFPSGQNIISITFAQPYMYTGGGNLVMMVNRPLDTDYYSSSDYFKTQTVGTNRSREMHSDTVEYDHTAPTGGTVSGIFPKTTFMVNPGGMGQIVGFVTDQDDVGIAGATVSAEGGFTTTTDSEGAYSLTVPAGVYSVTAVAAAYDSLTYENIIVVENEQTTLNFIMMPVANEDELVPIIATALGGNYPNPFNPETTIHYNIKDATNVRLNVYNVKGQLVRSLVNANQAAGAYRVVFNGRDDRGNPLSSGIYLYRFTAGKYSSTRKMMLME